MPKATIVGAGIGGIVALSLLGAAVFFWTRNRRRRRRPEVPVKDVKYSDGGEWQKSELPGTEVHEYNVSGGDGEEWQKSELPGAERQKSELPGAENEVKGYMQAHELDAIERS